jgi:hypothetical protein
MQQKDSKRIKHFSYFRNIAMFYNKNFHMENILISGFWFCLVCVHVHIFDFCSKRNCDYDVNVVCAVHPGEN